MNTPDLDPRSQDLADRLARRAGSVDLGPPVVDVVIGRGRQRRQRRRTAVGVTAVVGIAGASIVAIAALTRPSDNGSIVAAPTGSDEAGTTVESPASSAPPATVAAPADTTPVDPLALVPSPFVWNRVDPDSSEAVSLFWGGADHGIAGDGPFVAWSTAPGRTEDYRPTLWRSEDGQRWQQIETDPDFVARNIAEYNGTFLTFGTSPATAAERQSDLSIGTSTDGGLTWQRSVLPLDTTDLAQEPGVQGVGVTATSMATSTAGVLLSAQVNAIVGLDTLLPPEYRNAAWNLSDDGIEVPTDAACQSTATSVVVGGVASTVAAGTDTTAAACEVTLFTWAELGISERAAAAVMRPELQLFFSSDGTNFQQIESPTGFDVNWTYARLTSFGDGFAALVNDANGRSRLLSTADGRSWTDLGEVPLDSPESIDEWGGQLVLTGWGAVFGGRSLIAVRDAAGNWATTDLRSFLQPGDGVLPTLGTSHLAVGPTGITIIGWLTADPVAEIGGVSVPLDGGVSVQVADTSLSHLVYGPDGALLAEVTFEQSSAPDLVTPIRDDTYGVRWEVRTDAGGPVVATYSADELQRAVSDSGAYDEYRSQLLVLHSSDGVSWSRESLDEVVGAKVAGSGGIRLAGNQVIVAANLVDDPNPDGTPKQVLMIGTPSS